MMNIIIKDRKDFSKFYSIYKKMSVINNATEDIINIIIYIEHLSPFDVVLISMFIIHLKQFNVEITVKADNEQINEYLRNIRLSNFCQSNYKEPQEINALDLVTALPIIRVDLTNLNYYIMVTLDYFKRFTKSKDISMLNTCISELINNVYDHSSKSKIGSYIFAQYYNKNNTIVFAVGDLGIGIPNVVNEFMIKNHNKYLEHKNALEWALVKNNSTKSKPHNQGKGLDTLNTFIKENKCTWKVFSDNVCMLGTTENNYVKNPIENFEGTIIEIIVCIDNLLEDEEELEDLW